jgi:small nuclear ribonucleoprotein (snRNP)-like protein
MGIDESFETAESLKGHFVTIVTNDGSEITGRLTDVEDLTAILANDDSHTMRISLGDVNWISRAL